MYPSSCSPNITPYCPIQPLYSPYIGGICWCISRVLSQRYPTFPFEKSQRSFWWEKIVLGGRQSYRQFLQVSSILVINHGVPVPSLPGEYLLRVFMVFGWYVFLGSKLWHLLTFGAWKPRELESCSSPPFTQNNCLSKKGQRFLSNWAQQLVISRGPKHSTEIHWNSYFRPLIGAPVHSIYNW